jgi:hypothetical protein
MVKKRDDVIMTVQEQVNPQEQAQQIWDQLDAEDAGQEPVVEGEEQVLEEGQPAEDESAAIAADEDAGEEKVIDEEQALKDKISGLESMLNQVTQRLRNAEGHIGGLNGQLKQQLQTAKQVATTGGEAPTANQLRAAQQSPQAMEDLKRDYPEFASAMESALNERLQSLEQRFQAPQQQQGIQQEDIQRLRAEISVEVQHPGWQARVQTPEFVGWLQRQPREVQMLAASESPQDAVRLLDLHSDASNAVSSQRTQRLSAAAAIPSGRSSSQARTKAIEDMTPQEYWRYLDELDKQKR